MMMSGLIFFYLSLSFAYEQMIEGSITVFLDHNSSSPQDIEVHGLYAVHQESCVLYQQDECQ